MCRCPTPIIFVYIRRNRSHQHKASSRKNNNSDSDGGAKTHSYRTAKLPVFLERASLAVFVWNLLVNIAVRRHALLCNFNEIYTKGRFYENIFWKPEKTA